MVRMIVAKHINYNDSSFNRFCCCCCNNGFQIALELWINRTSTAPRSIQTRLHFSHPNKFSNYHYYYVVPLYILSGLKCVWKQNNFCVYIFGIAKYGVWEQSFFFYKNKKRAVKWGSNIWENVFCAVIYWKIFNGLHQLVYWDDVASASAFAF